MGVKKVKIQLYNKERTKEQVLSKFGDYILDDICISCTVEEDLYTTEYFLDAEFVVDNKGLYKFIEEDAVLKVQLDYGEELFSIVDIRKTPSRVIVFARQITITESICSWLEDVRPEGKNGQDALDHLAGYAIGQHNIEFQSDISLKNTAYYYDKTLYDALHIADNCFAIRWGGEVRRRGYVMIINEKLGKESDVQIRSGRNLTGFEANTNIDNIITRIKPVGFNGITTEDYIDSPLIDKYKYIRTQTMEYNHVKLSSDVENEPSEGDLVYDTLAEAQAKLEELALLEYLNLIDVLKAEYTINFIDLSKTEEYKNYAKAEVVQLGDEISVYEEKYGINITVRAIKRTYNVLDQKVIEMSLSNRDLSENNAQAEAIKEITSRLDQVVENVGYMNVTYAKIADLEAAVADIEELEANKANITELNATKAEIGTLSTDVASIKTIMGGTASTGSIQTIHLTSANTVIEDALIKNAAISDLSAGKLTAGIVNTDAITLKSTDGSMLLEGSYLQFKDENDKVRIQLGKDSEGNFTFALLDSTGEGTLITENGITDKAIPYKGIVDSHISDDASITGGKLAIDTVISSMNNDDSGVLLSTSKIVYNETNQSLEVILGEIKEDVGDNTKSLDTFETKITVQQGQIDTLIKETNIESEDGTTTSIKDAFTSLEQTVDGFETRVNTLETDYDSVTGEVQSVSSKQSSLEQDVDGFKITVSDTYATKDALDSELKTLEDTFKSADEALNVKTDGISSEVSTLKSDVSSLEVTTDSINSKVSTLEGDVSSLEVTTEGISSKVSNLEGDVSTLKVTTNSISSEVSSKVDANEVSTIIQQDSTSVNIGFNGISSNVQFTNGALFFRNALNAQTLSLMNGSLYAYNYIDNTFLGSFAPYVTQDNSDKGLSVIGAANCQFFSIGRGSTWYGDDINEPAGLSDYFVINFTDRSEDVGDLAGIHAYAKVYASGGINLQNSDIIAGGSIRTEKIYTDNYYSTITEKLMFRSDGTVMYNGADWDWQYHNILDPTIIGGTVSSASYGVEAVTESVSLMSLDDEETNTEVSANENTSILDEIQVLEIQGFTEESNTQLILDVSNVTNKETILLNETNVDLGKLVTLLVKEIQELKAEIKELKNEQ